MRVFKSIHEKEFARRILPVSYLLLGNGIVAFLVGLSLGVLNQTADILFLCLAAMIVFNAVYLFFRSHQRKKNYMKYLDLRSVNHWKQVLATEVELDTKSRVVINQYIEKVNLRDLWANPAKLKSVNDKLFASKKLSMSYLLLENGISAVVLLIGVAAGFLSPTPSMFFGYLTVMVIFNVMNFFLRRNQRKENYMKYLNSHSAALWKRTLAEENNIDAKSRKVIEEYIYNEETNYLLR